MRNYQITLTINGENLTASPTPIDMGAMYDNGMHQLNFVRPEQFNSYELLLHFQNDKLNYNSINLGAGNSYVVPNILMIDERLNMQVAFQSGQDIIHSTWVRFRIGKSFDCPGVALESIPLPSGPPGPEGPQGPQGPPGEDGVTVEYVTEQVTNAINQAQEYTDTKTENAVNYDENDDIHVINNLIMGDNGKILGTTPDGVDHVLIETATYDLGTPEEFTQNEVGSRGVHMNINSSDRPTIEVPGIDKQSVAYLSDVSSAGVTPEEVQRMIDTALNSYIAQTANLADASVTADKLAAGSVTDLAFADGLSIEPSIAVLAPATTILFEFSEDGATFSFTGGSFGWFATHGHKGIFTTSAKIDISYVSGSVIVMDLTNPDNPSFPRLPVSSAMVITNNQYVVGTMYTTREVAGGSLIYNVTMLGAGTYRYNVTTE